MASKATNRIVKLLFPLVAVLALAMCDESDPVDVDPEIATIDVTPATNTLNAVGATTQLNAVARDAGGNAISGVTFSWSSDANGVATVSNTGQVTAQGDGQAEISAQAQGVTGTATVTVAIEVDEVVVTPAEASIETGASTTFAADVLDANGNAVAGASVGWTSSDEDVATIDQNGEATGQSAGTVTITAESDGVPGTATLTVTVPVASVEVTPAATTLDAVGATAQLSATVLDEDGGTVQNPAVMWSSDDEDVATVDGNGLVTAQADGMATITATVGSVSGTATVTVAQELTSVSISPPSAEVEVDGTVTFTAQAEDANGNEIPGATFTWSSDDEAVATVDGNGVATGVAEGTATITATTDGISGTASLTVAEAAGAPSLSMVSGDGQFGKTQEDFGAPLVVQVTDDNGDPVGGITVTWDVTSGTGTLSTESVVTNSQGRASVTVTSGRNTGNNVVEATAEGTEGGPVTFNLRTSVIVVSIVDNAFIDTQNRQNENFEVNIQVGDTVEWKYQDNQASVHTVTSDSNPAGGSTFDSGNMSPGDTFRFAPQMAGTWTFFCELHPNIMVGSTITVTNPAASPRREDGDGMP